MIGRELSKEAILDWISNNSRLAGEILRVVNRESEKSVIELLRGATLGDAFMMGAAWRYMLESHAHYCSHPGVYRGEVCPTCLEEVN